MNTTKIKDQTKFNTQKVTKILEKQRDLELLPNLNSINHLTIMFQVRELMIVNTGKPKANHHQSPSQSQIKMVSINCNKTTLVLANTPISTLLLAQRALELRMENSGSNRD